MNHKADEEFMALLRRRLENRDRRSEIDAEIDRRFRTVGAVMMTDSVGFSRRTRERGIVHVLSLLQWHGERLKPVIEAHGGDLLKREADNLFSFFPTVNQAVAAARDMIARLREHNDQVPMDESVMICVGIGYGPVLRLSSDAYGDQVNLASKLGEDTAEGGEILLTAAARKALEGDDHVEAHSIEPAAGLTLDYFKLL